MKEFVFIKVSWKGYYKANFKDIQYIKADKDYVEIYSSSQSFFRHSTITNVMAVLDSKMFVRCHRSYIININRITAIENCEAIIDGIHIPISETYYSKVLKSINAY